MTIEQPVNFAHLTFKHFAMFCVELFLLEPQKKN